MQDEDIFDVTGVKLTPGNMIACLGNGQHVDKDGNTIECCCDECDYLILCLENEKKNAEKSPKTEDGFASPK